MSPTGAELCPTAADQCIVLEAHLFLQAPDERCGREWIDFRYFVKKRN